MKNYYRIMAGKKSVHAKTCLNGNFIGADFDIAQDLTNKLPDEWRAFSKEFIPKILETVPGKTKIGAAHDCVALWKVSKGIVKGDIVLCPDGAGTYRVGEISGDYFYAPGDVLPHRRPVRWLDASIARADMSDALKKSTSSASTLMDASRYREEIEKFIGGVNPPPPDETVEDAVEFALEKHLEDFLVQNWAHTELGKNFDIVEADGGQVGQQFPTDTGSIDILAIRKDKKELLIVELKKGRASDAVVGQILRDCFTSCRGDVESPACVTEHRVSGVEDLIRRASELPSPYGSLFATTSNPASRLFGASYATRGLAFSSSRSTRRTSTSVWFGTICRGAILPKVSPSRQDGRLLWSPSPLRGALSGRTTK